MINIKNLPPVLRRDKIEEKLLKIIQENDVSFMAIFGSFVRGEQRKKSDIDIAIQFDKNAKKSLFDLIDLENELKNLFRRKVDLGIYDTIKPHAIENVKKEMKVIYED